MLKNLTTEGWRWARRHSRLLAAAAVLLIAVGALPAMTGTAKAVTPVQTDISVLDSNGSGIAGVQIIYAVNANSGWSTLGTTDGAGDLVTSAAPGNYLLAANYNQGSAETPSPVDISQAYTFHTVKVTLLNSGLTYATNGNSGYHTYTGPMQMFPGQYVLGTAHGVVPFTVGNSDFTGGVVTLLDHSGNGLAGGTASYYLGGWAGLPGTTDGNGNLVFAIPSDSSYLSIQVGYNGTLNEQNRTQLTASNFTFQTALANVKLEDADGNPLDTGSAAYYASGWQPAQNTSGGVASFEMLPGSYSFAMSYNHTGQQMNGVAITGPTTDVVFQTGRLTAYFSQPFYWYNSQFYLFSPSTQEFLPGMVGLQLPINGCETPKFAIAAGDHLVKTGIVATLADSANHPLAGGTASAYVGGWQSVGTTNAAGIACGAVNGMAGSSTSVSMLYNGSSQTIAHNQHTNSFYNFQTTNVTVVLKDSTNQPLVGDASYYAGGWHDIGLTSAGDGTVHVQMLPGSYSFAMTYQGTRQQLNGQSTGSPVVFQTDNVAVQLKDSSGALMDIGTASYYAGGWHTIGTTSDGVVNIQMLPGSYSFAMTYQGTREQLDGQSTGSPVVFQTGQVSWTGTCTVTSYYANGWKSFANGQEMLPGTYWFGFSNHAQMQNPSAIVAGPGNSFACNV